MNVLGIIVSVIGILFGLLLIIGGITIKDTFVTILSIIVILVFTKLFIMFYKKHKGTWVPREKKPKPTKKAKMPKPPKQPKPIKLAEQQQELKERELYPLKFEVMSWGQYVINIMEWQTANAKDQWVDGNYSEKRLYQYAWTKTYDVLLIANPSNEFDQYAIEVLLGGKKIGYVPDPINKQYYNELLNSKDLYADVRNGNSKYLDIYGDLVVDKKNPIVDLTVFI
ncbi:MAG: hypothetical protein ACOX4U_00640 [Anaerovoracaceae bacterium]|jgi:hypothetical protein